MAKKEVSIILRARNMMAAGLASAGKSLQSFGQTAAHVGAFFAKAFLAAGAAIVAFSTKALMAYSVQEKAEKAAEAALRAYGDEVDNNVANIKRFAAAIQDETGIADESTIAQAARLRLLGVAPDQLEAATKATIALAKAGMGEDTAMKAVAAAMEGNFEQLTRYLPALKSATTEAEKAAIVNDFLTAGYAAQKDELDTVSGQWGALKGRVGDAFEAIGGAIAQQGVLTGMLKRAGDAVKGLGDRIAAWAAAGGVANMIQTFKLFGANVQDTMSRVSAYVHYGLTDAWESVKWFGDAASTVFKNAGKIIENTWRGATEQAGYYIAKLYAKITKQEWNLQPPKMADIMAGVEDIPKKSGEAAAELFRQLDELDKKHAAKQAAIADKMISIADEKAAAVEQGSAVEVAAAERIEVAKVNGIKAIEDEIAAVKKKMAIHGEMAKKTIADILAEQKAREDAGKAWDKDVRRAAQLEARQKRGARLSKRDQKWLAAFGQIQAARQGLQAGQGALNQAQKQLAAMQDQGKKLVDIRDELKKTRDDLNKLLQRG